MSATDLLRITRLREKFGMTFQQAAVVAGLHWEGRA